MQKIFQTPTSVIACKGNFKNLLKSIHHRQKYQSSHSLHYTQKKMHQEISTYQQMLIITV